MFTISYLNQNIISGQLMWRRPNCSETDSKTEQYLNNCFDCKNFDDHVQSCDTHLQLRNNTVTCAANTVPNVVNSESK